MKLKYDIYSATNQRLIDAFIAGVSFYLSFQFRFEWHVPDNHAFQLWLLVPAIMVGHVLVGQALGVYRLIWRYISLTDALTVARSHLVFSTLLLVLRVGLPKPLALLRIPMSVIFIQFFLSLMGSLSARVLRRILDQRGTALRTRAGAKKQLLIGAGKAGVLVAKEIHSNGRGLPVGFLDDDPKKIGSVINGVPVLGPLDSLPTAVQERGAEEIVICIPRPPRATLKRLWLLCEGLPVQIPMKIVPTLEEILQGKVNIASFRDVQMADLLGRETVEFSVEQPEVAAAYQGKRILITGAGGSIGGELVQQLVGLSPEMLILLDKDENGLNDVYLQLAGTSNGATVHPVVADIRFPDRLRAVFSALRPEVVFHAAAHKHVPLMEMNPCEAILNNVVGTQNLIEQSLAFEVSRFVFISTDKAVRPRSIMGASKRVCEMIVQARADRGTVRFAVVRFGNVMGSRGSVVPFFQKQIASGGPVTITHPEVRRFLMTIPEAVRLVIQAGTLGEAGEIFVLEMGDPVPILNLAKDLIELSGHRPDRDIRIEMTQLRPGEKISEELFDPETETLAGTRFQNISEVKTSPLDRIAFEEKLKALNDAALRQSAQEVYRLLAELVRGYEPPGGQTTALERAKLGVGESSARS